MCDKDIKEPIGRSTFGQRKVAPRVCIANAKRHVLAFLGEGLEELGFVVSECAQVGELNAVLDAHLPDIVVIDVISSRGKETGETLKILAARKFGGNVLFLGPRSSSAVADVRKLGEQLGVSMLPTLATPFRNQDLRNSIAAFLPVEAPPSPAVDLAEALTAGWLELWYQPKIDTRTLVLCGAEALIRLRHPTWGIITPAYFIPYDSDPHCSAFSEFVISRAVADWRYFADQHYGIEIAINMPATFLQNPDLVWSVCKHVPDHGTFEGLIIEINGTGVIGNMELAKDVAKKLMVHNIAISIDDLGAEWPMLIGLDEFPFAEIKVNRKFVADCANNRLKRSVCRQILDLADYYGVRTVAEGVETREDYVAVHALGFDIVQGFLFGKAMTAKKFARTMLRGHVRLPGDPVARVPTH